MRTIAVMQPYFFPYAGYFRLFTGADAFVVLDCVQMPNPGWVHRNRFTKANGESDWLTLPLAKAPYTTRIQDLRFRPDAAHALETALRRFPLLNDARGAKHPLMERIFAFGGGDVTEYLHGLLAHVTQLLGIEKPMVRSSSLDLDPELRGQDRVLAIVEKLQGTQYVNAPGGRSLYDHEAFSRSGIALKFLTPYGGSTSSMLTRLLTEPAGAIRDEIERETVLVD